MIHPSDSWPEWDAPPPTILVVDDEPVIRALIAMLLQDEGYTVRQAGDGLAAWEVLEQGGIDLVLSDVMMPQLDGPSLARWLHASGSAVPILLMSAVYAEVDLPGIRFLRKPIDLECLFDIIASVLHQQSDHVA